MRTTTPVDVTTLLPVTVDLRRALERGNQPLRQERLQRLALSPEEGAHQPRQSRLRRGHVAVLLGPKGLDRGEQLVKVGRLLRPLARGTVARLELEELQRATVLEIVACVGCRGRRSRDSSTTKILPKKLNY